MLPGAPERVQSLLCQEAVSPALPSPELGLVGWGRQGREYEAGELIASSRQEELRVSTSRKSAFCC